MHFFVQTTWQIPLQNNSTCRCFNVQILWAFQMFVTCNSSSSEQLQRPQPSIVICQLPLGVGINGEVDGGEGNVTQEASFGSLTEKKEDLKNKCIVTGQMNEQRQQWSRFVFGIKWSGIWFILTYGGALVLMMEPKSPRHWASREKSITPQTSVCWLLLPRGSPLFLPPPSFFFFQTSHTLSAAH